jgi:hypothetical protein
MDGGSACKLDGKRWTADFHNLIPGVGIQGTGHICIPLVIDTQKYSLQTRR